MTLSLISGKVFAITGAASGIGRALATVLARQGALLSLADINQEALAKVKAEIALLQLQQGNEALVAPDERISDGATILTTVVDVRSQTACNEWILSTVSHFKQPLLGAANLAGVFGPSIAQECGALRNITDDEFDRVMDVNVKGTLNCLRAQLPHMQVGDNGRHGGSIVNASSIAGISGFALNGPYAAAKHAIVGITRTIAKEEGQRAIRVNAISPGIIATPMVEQIEEAMGMKSTELFGTGEPGALARKGDAEEVAEVVAFLLGPQSSFVNGVVLPIDGGWIC